MELRRGCSAWICAAFGRFLLEINTRKSLEQNKKQAAEPPGPGFVESVAPSPRFSVSIITVVELEDKIRSASERDRERTYDGEGLASILPTTPAVQREKKRERKMQLYNCCKCVKLLGMGTSRVDLWLGPIHLSNPTQRSTWSVAHHVIVAIVPPMFRPVP